jgi:ATP-binding cassette subfamily B protein
MLGIFRKFFNFSGDQKGRFYRSLVFFFLQSVFEAVRIPAIAVVISALIEGSMTGQTVLVSLAIMVVSVVGCALTQAKSTMDQTVAGYTVCANKRVEIGERLKYMPMGYFNANNLGAIASVTTNTCEALQDVATRVILMYLQGVMTTSVICLALFFFDWRIGLVASAGMAVFFAINAAMQRASRRVSPRKIASDARLVDAVLEYVQGIGVVKGYNLAARAGQKVSREIDEANDVCFSMEKTFIPYMTVQSLAFKVFGLLMMLCAILFYLNGSMSLINTVLMLICTFIVYGKLESAGMYSALLRVVDQSVDKVQEIFKTPVMDEKGREIEVQSANIEGKNISFSYDKRKIIDGVSFSIPEKTTTAIVGPSGGGKTTLTSLIARFWDVNGGSIALDGRDVREYTLDSLLKNISMVFQNVYLFNDTVGNNIKFGTPGATRAQVEEAAKKASCHDFIQALPEGYDTMVGEGGATISGGEKQRIAIARAMLKDAPIIILDEATANVDPENEKHLMDAIHELTRDKTIIMIAHRLKTVRHADQILVVDGGKIVQRGTHAQLMAEGGLYKHFVDMREKSIGWKLGA